MSEHPGYECPTICEVDHIHFVKCVQKDHIHLTKIKEEEDVRKNGSTSPEGQQRRDSRLHKPEGGHPTDRGEN